MRRFVTTEVRLSVPPELADGIYDLPECPRKLREHPLRTEGGADGDEYLCDGGECVGVLEVSRRLGRIPLPPGFVCGKAVDA